MNQLFFYNVTQHPTAVANQTNPGFLWTEVIQDVIDNCSSQGGGTIYFPAGVYTTGSILLKSNITLYLEAGARLTGSRHLEDYPHKHLIYAADAHNITITGPGCIDGQGDAFWGKQELRPSVIWRGGWGEVSHYYTKTLARPERLIRFAGCREITISQITLTNSPSWTLHLLACDHVKVRDIHIDNPLHGPNTDGIDIDSCEYVSISGCHISTGDDAIVLKNTNLENRKKPCKNITITNCILTSPCNAFKIGTETQSDIHNITFTDSVIYAPDHALCYEKPLSGVSIEMVDGAHLSHVVVSNLTIHQARCPIFVRLGNRGRGQEVPVAGTLSDIQLSNIQAYGAVLPCIFSGIEGHPIERLSCHNLQLSFEGIADYTGAEAYTPTGYQLDFDSLLTKKATCTIAGHDALVNQGITALVPELPADYPESIMFGRYLPVYGLFARHIKGLTLSQISLRAVGNELRCAIAMDDVQ